ncbi:hypothetical protein EBO33_05585 [[Curtobacterium] plantarum]|nr:hypothetical protein EBO33_05585 [[Curtobacterium] plantarum]
MNNATRWPGNGRTSGMRCVIARAERPGIGFSVFPICPCSLCRLNFKAHHGEGKNAPIKNPAPGGIFFRYFPVQALRLNVAWPLPIPSGP